MILKLVIDFSRYRKKKKQREYSWYYVEEKDILQINVTIIAGAFIFLSLSLALVDNLRSTTGSNQTFITLVDKTETKVNLLASLRTTIPMNMVRQWNLKPGSKLDWSWEVVNGEMVIVVRGKES